MNQTNMKPMVEVKVISNESYEYDMEYPGQYSLRNLQQLIPKENKNLRLYESGTIGMYGGGEYEVVYSHDIVKDEALMMMPIYDLFIKGKLFGY